MSAKYEAEEAIEIPDEAPLLPTTEPFPTVDLYPATVKYQWRHYLTKRNVKKLIYTWRWAILIAALGLVFGLLMYTYRVQVFQALETLSHKVADLGYKGYVLMASLIFLSAFPPIIGYGTYQTLSGYTFGFSIGFPISYFSALFGAMACFSLSRLFLKARVARMMSRYRNLEAVVKAVEKKGFKLFVLIRLSPYPFNLLNVLFATTDISLWHFGAGTALTLLKIALYVYIGANLTSFAKHILGEDGDMTEAQLRAEQINTAAVVVGSFLTFGVMAYIYTVAKAAVEEANLYGRDEEQDIELSHGFLDDISEEEEEVVQKMDEPMPRESSVSLENWDNWGDEDEEYEPISEYSKKLVDGKHD